LDPDYPSPSDYGWFNLRGCKTLRPIWGGIAINVKPVVIPDTILRNNASPDYLPPRHAERPTYNAA
jgi:hypothetical protein